LHDHWKKTRRLQSITAEQLGFNRILMAASNSAGGVLGKMISLQSIALLPVSRSASNRN
jgi:L-lactate permease